MGGWLPNPAVLSTGMHCGSATPAATWPMSIRLITACCVTRWERSTVVRTEIGLERTLARLRHQRPRGVEPACRWNVYSVRSKSHFRPSWKERMPGVSSMTCAAVSSTSTSRVSQSHASIDRARTSCVSPSVMTPSMRSLVVCTLGETMDTCVALGFVGANRCRSPCGPRAGSSASTCPRSATR